MLDALTPALASASEAADWVDQQSYIHACQLKQTLVAPFTDAQSGQAYEESRAQLKGAIEMELGEPDKGQVAELGDSEAAEQDAREDSMHAEAEAQDPGMVQLRLSQKQEELQSAQEAPQEAQRRGLAGNAWRSFVSRLRSAARGRLPDLQPLLALHASLDAEMHGPDTPHPMEVCASVQLF